jgi:hypothetical protein
MDVENQSVRITHTVDVSTEPRNSLNDIKEQGMGITSHNAFESAPWTRRRMGSIVGCEGDVSPTITMEDLAMFKERSRASSDAHLVRGETEADSSKRRFKLEQTNPVVTRLKC